MTESENDFLQRLLATFRLEAREHVDALYRGIAALERRPEGDERNALVETVFREAHSLKGAARSVNQGAIETACQALESTFAAMKRGEIAESSGLFDNLQLTLKQLSTLVNGTAPPPAREVSQDELDMAAAPPPRPPKPTERATLAHTVRIATERLDSILLQAEEMLATKLLMQQRRQELAALQAMTAAMHKAWSDFNPGQRALQAAEQAPMRELLDQNTVFIKSLNHQLNAVAKATEQDQRMVGRMVDDLLEDMKKALMLPFSTLLELFPRLVRDLAKDRGKEIELSIVGEELEADRRLLEAMKDPLIHLVRNSIDHGIETPEGRLAAGKTRQGKIVIAIQPRSGNRVEIIVSDDGAGIDADLLISTAQRLGLLSPEEAADLDTQAAMELAYLSGVSTSPIITEISGRGLGLAIVREKVEQLSGTIDIRAQPRMGTSFRIQLPLTLATYRGITVRVGDQVFVLPTSHVEQTTRVPRSDIRTVENQPTVHLNGTTHALVRLGDVLQIVQADTGDDAFIQIALLNANGKHIAFVVDEVLNEQEVLVKSLGKQLSRVRNIAAATILGSGKAVPILNIADLIKSALQLPAGMIAPAPATPDDSSVPQKRVLVVEDSITARSLIKGILELAGYAVSTAVDGVDGYTQLRGGAFDIVVSDVEMPRMNGFELTAKIREDKKLADVPVILVTALESREDRERGIEVGADAYIVKRSFEQSNLLEVIGRLL